MPTGIDWLPIAGVTIQLGFRGGQQEQPRRVCPGSQLTDQLRLELRAVAARHYGDGKRAGQPAQQRSHLGMDRLLAFGKGATQIECN